MNPEFTRCQKLPFVSDPAEMDRSAQPSARPYGVPQGLGLRQPSTAFPPTVSIQKRQGAAAVQDAAACAVAATPSRA